jgi:hypothetical protein
MALGFPTWLGGIMLGATAWVTASYQAEFLRLLNSNELLEKVLDAAILDSELDHLLYDKIYSLQTTKVSYAEQFVARALQGKDLNKTFAAWGSVKAQIIEALATAGYSLTSASSDKSVAEAYVNWKSAVDAQAK